MEEAEMAALHKEIWETQEKLNRLMGKASDGGLTVRARVRNDGQDPDNLVSPKSRPQIEVRVDRPAPWPVDEPKPPHLRLVTHT